ncbi:MAG TPA: VOC family protein [Mycobacteriales bacterium]|nr:VOC family protein [Mycobacteriales bacterium]
MPNPVVHFEIVGGDTKTLRDFYAQAFDWQIQQMPSDGGIDYAMAMPGGDHGINGGIGAGMDPSQSYVTFYVEVPDIDAALAKAGTLGGSTVMPAMDVPNGPRIAMFKDPGGHVVGLIQAGSMASP